MSNPKPYYEVQLLTECNKIYNQEHDFSMYRNFENRDAAFYAAGLMATFIPFQPHAASIFIIEYPGYGGTADEVNKRIIATIQFTNEFNEPLEGVSPFCISNNFLPFTPNFNLPKSLK